MSSGDEKLLSMDGDLAGGGFDPVRGMFGVPSGRSTCGREEDYYRAATISVPPSPTQR